LRIFHHFIERLSGQNKTAFFFQYVNPFCNRVAFEAGSAVRVTFLNPPRTLLKEFRNQKLNFSIVAHICHIPGRFGEDHLGTLGDMASKISKN